MRDRLTALGCLFLVAAGLPARAAGTPGARCATAKLRAVGRAAAGELDCQAQAASGGVPVRASCVRRRLTAFATAFTRAESRGGCAATGDATAVGAEVEEFVALVASALPDGGNRAGRRCAAAKLRATAARVRGELACHAQVMERGATVRPACLARRETGFATAFARAQAKRGCATTGDAEAIETEVDRFIASVTGAPPVTTTTAASSSTTLAGATSTTGAGATTSSTSAVTTTTTLPSNVSFAAQVQPIFTANCALAGCHAGTNPPEGLKLTASRSYGALVNVQSKECSAYKRVAPGSPDASYLVFKLRGAGPCFLGGQMPLGYPPLPAGDQATITVWIQEGARNN